MSKGPDKAAQNTRFLAELRIDGNITRAAAAAGFDRTTGHNRMKADPRFMEACQDAIAASPQGAKAALARPGEPGWDKRFLAALAETSNVSGAAHIAGVTPRSAYARRRHDPQFAAQWAAALLEGYEHLEMELLGYLRDPAPVRKMDTGAALRLLAAHREEAVREKARRARVSEASVLDELKERFERLREHDPSIRTIMIEDGTAARDDDGEG